MKLIKLEEAMQEIYSMAFTPERGINVFSSITGQSIAEVLESIQSNEEVELADKADDTRYALTIVIVPIGELFRDYLNNVFSSNDNLNTKIFRTFLYPYYLESMTNASFAILSADGIEACSDYVHTSLEMGYNQFINLYCLRNKVEEMDTQNAFIIKEIEKTINLHYKDIERLETFNFTELQGEFLGWASNFPAMFQNYMLNLGDYNPGTQEETERIKIDLLEIAENASILAVDLKRV